jgi:hypothetical protein
MPAECCCRGVMHPPATNIRRQHPRRTSVSPTRHVKNSIATRAFDASTVPAPAPPRRRRMLALHGKGGDGASFERYMQPLIDATSHDWDWEFPTGPHDDGSGAGGRAWWKLPPGVRTFEAAELEGIEESLAMVEQAWPFDGVMGFSQGAMLAAVVCGRGLKGQGWGTFYHVLLQKSYVKHQMMTPSTGYFGFRV